MLCDFWVQVTAKKRYGSWSKSKVAAFSKKPTTDENQVGVKITIDIPDEVFNEPTFEATIKLPKTVKILPMTTEVAKSISDTLHKETGFRVKVDCAQIGEAANA